MGEVFPNEKEYKKARGFEGIKNTVHNSLWVGTFYKDEKEGKLAAYSRVFKIVEIDSTFCRYPYV
jgi:hypothetical protein